MKRKRLFISSVQKEFATERKGLRDFLRGDPLLRKFFEVFLFEDLPAKDRRANEVYLDEVARCDVYLGLFGNEYGFENRRGVSPTESEFNTATARCKPRLIYIKGSNDKTKHPKMQALIHKAGDELIRRRFDDLGTLLPAVYASLVEYLEEHHLIASGPFDAGPCVGANLKDLSRDAMRNFIRLAREARGFPLRETAKPTELLTHLNLLHENEPTQAAMLLFGSAPQRFLPTSEVKCAHFHGLEVTKPIPSYQVYQGTIFTMVDQSVDFVMAKLALRIGTRTHSVRVPVTYEIPREVVAEAIVNAVAHRDYASNGSVQVMLFADRLEIWNPVRLPTDLTLARLKQPHASIPHNPLLAEPLYRTQYIERLGTGIGDIIKRCRIAGLKEPEIELGDGFKLTIWRVPTEASSVNTNDQSSVNTSGRSSVNNKPRDSNNLRATESKSMNTAVRSSVNTEATSSVNTGGRSSVNTSDRIVNMMRDNPEITVPELASQLGITKRAIEKQISQLREQEIIGRIGPAKGGHWEILL